MSERPSGTSGPDVLIVGGGVIGLCIAESLTAERISVRVVEADAVGSGASGAAAGMLAPISETHGDSPLLPLGLESLRRFSPLCARLRDETGIDPEYEPSGILHLARGEADVEALAARVRAIEASHRHTPWPIAPELEWLEGDALRQDTDELASDWTAGFRSPREAHLRPPLLVRALEASSRKHGVRIEAGIRAQRLRIERDRVVGIESSAGRIEAGITILATGVWTPAILDASGLVLSRRASESDSPVASAPRESVAGIDPVRGQILTLEAPLPAVQQICWSSDVYLVPKRDGSWIVGATEERVGFDRRVTAEGVAWLLARAREIFPTLSNASFGRAWAGLRPVSRDERPFVGRVPDCAGLLLAAGHGRNGVLLAPITAQLVVDEVLGKSPVDAWRADGVGSSVASLLPGPAFSND